MRTILVAGGYGFIGSHFINMIMQETDWNVINIDKMSYASKAQYVKPLKNRYTFAYGDISKDLYIKSLPQVDAIVNFAAESHVDNSISNPEPFIISNVVGTLKLLEKARRDKCRYLQVSTDEVYGSIDGGLFTENSPIQPNSPYSASKASADHLVQSYHETYGLDTIITRCCNNYGSHQHKEKLIPKIITNLNNNQTIPIYGDGSNVREWIHVKDHCSGIFAALTKGTSGEVYNIGSGDERSNYQLVTMLLELMDKDESSIKYVTDRLGHDKRYAIDSNKIQTELGWKPTHTNFYLHLKETINWYSSRQ